MAFLVCPEGLTLNSVHLNRRSSGRFRPDALGRASTRLSPGGPINAQRWENRVELANDGRLFEIAWTKGRRKARITSRKL